MSEGEQVLRLLDLPGRHLRRRRRPGLCLDRDHRQLPGKRPCRFFGWRIFTLCYFFPGSLCCGSGSDGIQVLNNFRIRLRSHRYGSSSWIQKNLVQFYQDNL
jgi:hypothetical protein